MARKKYLDENGDETQGLERKCHQNQGLQSGKPFPNHFLGGGTKNEYRHSNSKNSDESQSHDGAVGQQLSTLGLNVREMPGDGNCLFRALSDQITGNSRNHLEYRRAVVQYMQEFRQDFEPFVEDCTPFDKYVQRLSQPGTFAGNDAIVAFARLQNVAVVIHQLNSPAWVIHPSKDSQEHTGGLPVHSGREVHIFYHNGDHYNSVRRIGDNSESPTNIRLHTQSDSVKPNFPKVSGKKSPPHTACSNAPTASSDCYSGQYESKRDEDYWVKDSGDVDRLVEEVMQQTNYPDPSLVRETLVDYNFDMVATIDFIISMSVMMNQHQYQEENTVKVVNSNGLNNFENEKTCDSDAVLETPCSEDTTPPETNDGETNSVEENPIDVTGCSVITVGLCQDDSQTTESDDCSSSNSSPIDGPISSQENAEKEKPIVRKETKRSTRQKKDLKRRERKREADRRKLANVPSVVDKENTVVVSHFGSLDI